jgi:hypothetical protein
LASSTGDHPQRPALWPTPAAAPSPPPPCSRPPSELVSPPLHGQRCRRHAPVMSLCSRGSFRWRSTFSSLGR